MFFLISKLTEFLFVPSNVIGIIFGAGLFAWIVGRRRVAAALMLISSITLLVVGWAPVGLAALGVLENRFPQPVLPQNITGMIMLGGAVDAHITSARATPTLNEAGERITTIATLARSYPSAKIFLSGGGGQVNADGMLSESRIAKNVLVSMGVPGARIAMEERSRNTCENAKESLSAIDPKPDETWVLVTSASQMPRAVACFRAVGFPVLPYPVDFRTKRNVNLLGPNDSIAAGLEATDLAAHEWMGLLTYRIAGMTNEVFPAP